MNKNILLITGGLFMMTVGACIGQQIGFKKADNTIKKIANTNHNDTCSRTIDGIEYLISVTKKED